MTAKKNGRGKDLSHVMANAGAGECVINTSGVQIGIPKELITKKGLIKKKTRKVNIYDLSIDNATKLYQKLGITFNIMREASI